MGKDRYHYDARGKFKGRSSDDPPMSGCMSVILIIVIIILLGISGLNKDKKSKEISDVVPKEQNLSDTDTNPEVESEENSVSESAATNEPPDISEVSTAIISDEGDKSEQQSEQQVIFLPRKEVSQQIPINPERKYPPCTDSVRDGCQGE